MIGVSSPGNSYLIKSLTDFHLNELKKLGIVNLVALVHEYNNVRNANLTSKEKVFFSLRPSGRR